MNIAPKNIILNLLLSLITLFTYAGTVPGGGPPQPMKKAPPFNLPIDDSVLLLVFVAIVYAFYILRKFKLESK